MNGAVAESKPPTSDNRRNPYLRPIVVLRAVAVVSCTSFSSVSFSSLLSFFGAVVTVVVAVVVVVVAVGWL